MKIEGTAACRQAFIDVQIGTNSIGTLVCDQLYEGFIAPIPVHKPLVLKRLFKIVIANRQVPADRLPVYREVHLVWAIIQVRIDNRQNRLNRLGKSDISAIYRCISFR